MAYTPETQRLILRCRHDVAILRAIFVKMDKLDEATSPNWDGEAMLLDNQLKRLQESAGALRKHLKPDARKGA